MVYSDANTPQPVFSSFDQLEPEVVVIDVSGAVVHPGVIEVLSNQRVATAIEKAGGFHTEADEAYIQSTLNLARVVSDGEKIYVPFEGELAAQQALVAAQVADDPLNSFAVNSSSTTTGGISLNTATASELMELKGIGEKRAEDIIAGRPYSTVDELLKQSIISESLFNSIQSELVL
ncbi:MAG: helix-hairpin-helix domain-containing protein [Pseudomonadales bacterium]|nr:helix-hairpin-helix domain-containing protein [Candidatus Woesebacteria bacterium]MCB9801887.1 helix-hairpin-helix domain-containing protein [Pseudomonadales bacterium]